MKYFLGLLEIIIRTAAFAACIGCVISYEGLASFFWLCMTTIYTLDACQSIDRHITRRM